MKKKLVKTAFQSQMQQVRLDYAQSNFGDAFAGLERAHIMGQRYFVMHVLTHWWMLKIGIKKSDRKEIMGQAVRMIAVFPGYIFGWVPKGNTGGANVSATKPMPIPDDLQELLRDYNVWKDMLIRLCTVLAIAFIVLFIRKFL